MRPPGDERCKSPGKGRQLSSLFAAIDPTCERT